MSVLEIRNLTVEYRTPRGPFQAVKHVSFSLEAGERFGLVGESGSGKSTTILALMRMLRGGHVSEGQILLNGRNLATVSDADYRALRFAEMSLVPQGAMSSLNPVLRIGRQVADIFDDHDVGLARGERVRVIGNLLERVGLASDVQDRFPHELSGGMKQRVCIAMSIALEPSLILADEPTANLDTENGKQVMDIMQRLNKETGVTFVFATHDPRVIGYANRVVTLQDGLITKDSHSNGKS